MPVPIIFRKRLLDTQETHSNAAPIPSKLNLVSRKPVVAERPRNVSAVSTASLSKTLPQCPPEREALDKIASLEARQDDLAHRKHNINKIIRELKEAMRRNSIIYEPKKRREVEQMIADFQGELTEIGQEEHEVGIKLHRAQKKRDKDDYYEQPTGLWIRRVTS